MDISKRNIKFYIVCISSFSFTLLLIYGFDIYPLNYLQSNSGIRNNFVYVGNPTKPGGHYLERAKKNYHNTLDVDYLHFEDFRKEPPLDRQLSSDKERLKSRIIRAERLYSQHVAERNWFLMTHPNDKNIHDVNKLENIFKPAFECPHLTKEVGGSNKSSDGNVTGAGKWICGFEIYKSQPRPQECVVYTFGLPFHTDFEREWTSNTDCKVLKFQFESQEVLQSNNSEQLETYPDLRIGTGDNGSDTLRGIMTKNEHGWLDILVLNIGPQVYDVLYQIMNDFQIQVLPFAQLIARFPVTNQTYYIGDFFTALESAGLRFFAGRSASKANKLEYSFLNLRGKHLLLVGSED